MAFKKGDPKPPGSGRKKGSRPTAKSLRQGLEAKGFDITDEFLTLFKTAEDPSLRFQILKEIAKYTQPPAPKEEPELDPPAPKEEPAQILQLLRDSLNEPEP